MSQLDSTSQEILHRTVEECFPPQLQIVDSIVLAMTDGNLSNLYEFFKPYQTYKFQPTERLIILHCDIDYYPSMDSAGNTMHNLIQIIAELDISTDHIVILSNSIGLAREIQVLADQSNITSPVVIDFALWYVYPHSLVDQVATIPHKNYLYSCLNGLAKPHRATMLSLLYAQDLVDIGIVSYHTGPSNLPESILNQQAHTENPLVLPGRFLRVTQPFTRYNNALGTCRESKKLQIEYAQQLATPLKHPAITGDPNSAETRFVVPFLQQSLVYVITETVGDYPYPWFSEKTWKAMSSMMPFMLLGPQHSLQTLRSFGFQTFSDFWDESYDTAPTAYQRAKGIVKNLQQLRSQDWNQLYQQLLPILTHNFEHLKTFQQLQLDKIKNLL